LCYRAKISPKTKNARAGATTPGTGPVPVIRGDRPSAAVYAAGTEQTPDARERITSHHTSQPSHQTLFKAVIPVVVHITRKNPQKGVMRLQLKHGSILFSLTILFTSGAGHPFMYSLEPTAAMVMIWAKPIYRSGMAARFVRSLDLSGGEELYRYSEASCAWYGEVIRNRKFFMPALARSYVKNAGLCQVLVPAAGMSPVALELIEDCGDHIVRAIETDVTGMEDKQELYWRLFPDMLPGIQCLSMDIRDRGTMSVLSEHGYDTSIPSVIIMEGISYYLSKQELIDVAGMYRSPDHSNVIIMEYVLPCEHVREERRFIPRNEFDTIKRYCNLSHIQCYTKETLAEALGQCGGTVDAHYTMCEMERARLGHQQYFKEPGDWWTECIVARV
jgi:O-methyltransferase involved in polyketide biosynthesis